MRTSIKFHKKKSDEISDCGNSLDIEISSKKLDWEGILLEKGSSPYFYPDNVYTKNFYFALDMGEMLNWKAKKDGQMIDLKTEAGSLWLNPPMSSFTHEIDETCYFIILTIEQETLFSAFDGLFPKDNLQFLKSYNIDDNNLKNMIEMFYNEVLNEGKNGSFYINSLIKLFSNYFIRNYSNYEDLINKKSNKFIINERDIETVSNYIEEKIVENITIDDLAEKLHMSKFYFLKEFKKSTGITPYKFIMNKKMEKAKLLLTGSNDSIIEITYSLGFNDQSHFSNTFKRYYGTTPKKYKDGHK